MAVRGPVRGRVAVSGIRRRARYRRTRLHRRRCRKAAGRASRRRVARGVGDGAGSVTSRRRGNRGRPVVGLPGNLVVAGHGECRTNTAGCHQRSEASHRQDSPGATLPNQNLKEIVSNRTQRAGCFATRYMPEAHLCPFEACRPPGVVGGDTLTGDGRYPDGIDRWSGSRGAPWFGVVDKVGPQGLSRIVPKWWMPDAA